MDFLRKREEIIWWGLALGIILGLALISNQSDVIGRDWRNSYRPATLSGDFVHHYAVANPAHVLFLFYPLAMLPTLGGYIVLMLLSVVSMRLIAHLAQVSKWLIFPSFPALWMLVYGQIDTFVALGVGLGWWAIRTKRPYWQGVATLLLCLKPHLGGLLALVYLFWQWDRRAFVVSGLVGVVSLVLFGLGWPIEWFKRLVSETGLTLNASGSFGNPTNDFNDIGLFPYGLLLWPLVLIPYPRQQKIPAIISACIASSPYAGNYSLMTVLAVPLSIWIYPLLSLPFLGYIGYRLVAVVPIVLVVYPVVAKYVPSFLSGRETAERAS